MIIVLTTCSKRAMF